MIYFYIYAKLNVLRQLLPYEILGLNDSPIELSKLNDMKTVEQRLEALEKAFQKLHPVPNASGWLDTKDPVTYVPDGILDNQGGIINGQHVLGFHKVASDWFVSPFIENPETVTTPKQFKLVECKREDLEVGDVAYLTDDQQPDFSCLTDYAIVSDGRVVFWDGEDGDIISLKSSVSWERIYKVVEVV